LYSSLLHEINHLVAWDNDKFTAFHHFGTDRGGYGKKYAIGYVRTALRAERYIEKLAKRDMAILFPGMKYHETYHTAENVEWFQENEIKTIKKEFGLK
jgi:hypothetical protein